MEYLPKFDSPNKSHYVEMAYVENCPVTKREKLQFIVFRYERKFYDSVTLHFKNAAHMGMSPVIESYPMKKLLMVSTRMCRIQKEKRKKEQREKEGEKGRTKSVQLKSCCYTCFPGIETSPIFPGQGISI